MLRTGNTRLQSVALRNDESRVSPEFADEHGKRTVWDVGVVELEMNVVDAVLVRQESTGVEVIVNLLDEEFIASTRRCVDEALERALGTVEVDRERGWFINLRQ